MELFATLAGVVFTAVIGFAAYQYRGMVTYKINHLSARLLINSNQVSVSEDGVDVHFCKVEINNRGYSNIENFEFFSDINYDLAGSEVLETSSIAKNTISVSQDGKSIAISSRSLPRGENLEVLMIFGGRNSLWKAKGGSAKYHIQPQAFYDGMMGVWNFIKNTIFYGVVFGVIFALVRNVIQNG
ncbi:hypothetical protein [Sphingopyxis sp.]|uniref:hypothetical protein n=1 Tax=Sphingopyxis sp. TaxID=1908224 RepID=UPI002B46A8E0|nr:hypothetical protein [Sphingopyxis sp.]HJS12865.1 hypothetical protein [Sphingopyxis sp.]